MFVLGVGELAGGGGGGGLVLGAAGVGAGQEGVEDKPGEGEDGVEEKVMIGRMLMQGPFKNRQVRDQ